MALRIHHTWHPVIGQRVQIRRGGIIMREGIVDAVTLDDSVLWIAGRELEPRAMFQRIDGFEVWLNYQWESGKGWPA